MSDGMRDADRPFSSQKGADLTPTLPTLDLRAVEARLMKKSRHRSVDVLIIGCDAARDIKALLAHARALRELVELGRITLTDNGSFPGKSLDWYQAQAMYLRRAAAVLAAAQDGPA